MKHLQIATIFCAIFAISVLQAKRQIKFDEDGHIVDDGLNLPAFPRGIKRPNPLISKSRPNAERVKGDSAPKASGIPSAAKKNVAEPNKDKNAAKLEALLEAAGLNKEGEKADHLKTDQIKSESVKGGTEGVDLSNFSPDEMKKIMDALQTAPGTNPSEGKGEGKDAKLNQGLRQMLLGGASGVEPKPGTLGPEEALKLKGLQDAALGVSNGSKTDDKEVEEPQQYKEGEEIQLYPWETEVCKDYDEEGCAIFKPMCNLFGITAHTKCRKTCKLCIQDKPKPRTLHATLKEFELTLTQNGPLAPTFLTMCVDNAASEKYGLPNGVLSVVVHAYGDVSDDTCENFGPHFNPFGVEHGHPEDTTKHAGDLGILEFRQIPEEWPEGVAKCNADQIGSYGVFDHINLYGENTPCMRPVVLYRGEAPMKEFKPSEAVACDVLRYPEMKSNNYGPNKTLKAAEEKNETAKNPADNVLNANRVLQTGKVNAKDKAAFLNSDRVKKALDAMKGITYAGKDETTKGPSATDAEAKAATKDKEEATLKPKGATSATNATGDSAADEGDW